MVLQGPYKWIRCFGSDPYTIDSGPCKSGLHKGIIDEYGGKRVYKANIYRLS